MSEETMFGKATFTSDDLGTGGGLHDDVDGVIVLARFKLEEWRDKNGNISPNAKPAIVCEIVRQFEDGTDESQYPIKYSVGTPDYWKPSADGSSVYKAKSDKTKFNKNYGFGKLVEKILGIGAGNLLADGAITGLVGHSFHWLNEPELDKDGKEKKNDKGYVITTPYPSRYIGKATPASGTAKAAPAGTPVAAKTSEGMVEVLKGFVMETVAAGPKTTKELFVAANKNADVKAVVPVSQIMTLLNGAKLYEDGTLVNDKGTVSLAG